MRVGFVLFDGVTQLDLTGPLQVFSQAPGYDCRLIAASDKPTTSDGPLPLTPTDTFATAPALDLVCVPGGHGVAAAMRDAALLSWLKDQARQARWMTSVCTGAFILGAAGLLVGRRATTHWAYHDLLVRIGAEPVRERVVFDAPIVTGGGVTAGIDFALRIVAAESGEESARALQLALEYDPAPPFAGAPDKAGDEVVAALRAGIYDDRRAVMRDACDAVARASG